MKKILVIFLFPVFGYAQDYSFNSADLSGALTAASLTVDNVAVDNATIGLSSDTDLLTVASGSLTLAGDLVTSSDKNLKSNIASLGPVLTKLISLNPKRYTMKNDAELKEKIGLLAQDVQLVYPELVSEDANGMLSVNYQALSAILINGIKDQEARLQKLEMLVKILLEDK